MTGLLNKIIRNRITRNFILVFVLLVILFITIWTRAFIGSMKNFELGKSYFDDRKYIKAITFFDRSMHWYTPFNPYVERSAEYLWQISEQAEGVNDEKLSLIAFESIRNSFYSARSFYSPGSHWIEKTENRIRSILQNQYKEKPGNNNSRKKGLSDTRMKYNDPDVFWTIILEIGLFGWIGTILAFIFVYLGFDKRKIKYVNTVWFWIILSVISYSLWIVGMIKA